MRVPQAHCDFRLEFRLIRVAIWICARPNKSLLALFDRSWPWNFWFGILAFFGLIGRVWPWTLKFGLNVVFWLYFGLFYAKVVKVPFKHHRISDRICAYAHIFRYHTLTVCYLSLLDRQSQCPVTYSVMSFITITITFSQNWHRQNVLSLMQNCANYTSVNVPKSQIDIYL